MPKIEVIDSDEDDDIWDYRSQTQKAKISQNSSNSKSSSNNEFHRNKQESKHEGRSKFNMSNKQIKTEGGSLTINKSQKQKKATCKKKIKVKLEVKTECAPNAKQHIDRSGRCPVCQMPFKLLSSIETPSWHMDQCLDVPYSSKNECPAGLECDSEFSSHYKKFRHTCIARSRRKNEITNRDRGNVESARSKLSFDEETNDRKLVLPGTSSDCIIILDSSEDSDLSQRPSNDAEDEDFSSPKDKIENEQISFGKNHKVTETLNTLGSMDSKGPQMKKVEGKVFDKNRNFLKKNACQDLEDELFGTNSGDEVQVIEDDFENDNAELEEMDINTGVVNVSDDSYGSVQDIDALVDDTRSVSDMIQDALAPDNSSDSETSEIFQDNMPSCGNNKNDNTNTGQRENEDFELNVEKFAVAGDQTCNDNRDDDEEDDLISLFTGRTSKSNLDECSKESAISGPMKTSEKGFLKTTKNSKSEDSNSSSDWEILKTTLSQPLFSDNSKVRTDTKVELGEDTALTSVASHITPTKHTENAVDIDKHHIHNTEAKEINDFEGSKEKQLPKRGFFATKMASHITPTKHTENAVDIDKHHIHNTEAKEINYFEGSKEKQLPKRGFFATKMLQLAKKNMSDHNKVDKTSEGKEKVYNFEDDQSKYTEEGGEKIKKTASKENYSKEMDSKCKFKSLKRKTTNLIVYDVDKDLEQSTTLEKVENENKNTVNDFAGKNKSDHMAKLTPAKVEVNITETIEKKPKIELKPKTPMKRKTGKKIQKIGATKKEIKNGSNTKLESFFKPMKDGEAIKILVQTDSESSGDYERFNKSSRFVKCCEKCTEEKRCKPKYIASSVNVMDISNSGDNNNRLLESEKMKFRRISNTSSSCSQGSWDKDSEATSCRGGGSSKNSIKLTISSNCQNCSQLGKSKSHSQSSRCKDSCEFSGQGHVCSYGNQCQGCSHHTQNSHGQSCSHKSQDGSFTSKEFGRICSMQDQSTSCHSQGQGCSKESQGQSFPSNSPSHTYSLQGQSCSHRGHSQSCSGQSQGDCGSQHCSYTESQNGNSNKTCSQRTLQLNIENVCTLSQNTYGKLGGGFIIPNEESNTDPVDIPHSSNQSSDVPPTSSSNARSGGSISSYLSEREVENIVQIRRSATEILMASSRLLYNKSIKKNSGAGGSQMSRETSGENSQQRRGFVRSGRSSTTSTETSDDSKDAKRKCPFYKKIPDTSMTVDAFRYGNIPDCKAYILSHFHYDHHVGLNKHFQNPIYCSKITGNLVKKKIGVDSHYINTIALNTPTVVENVEITFLEANHCPGAVLILFKLKSGKVFLHTGDFRASQAMEVYPALQNVRIHSLYLDTTYCDPQYDFPPQEEVINFTVQLVLDALASKPRTLIVCGTYTIGKERIFTAIAEELDCKICVMRDKKNVLDCMEDERLKRRVSLNWEDSRLHVLPMNKINYSCLQEHLLLNGKKFNSVLGIEPTGWTHNKKVLSLHHIKPKVNKDNIKVYGVPYSEHSSFLELKRFIQFTRPAKILPTVNNGNVHSRKKMEVIFEAWMSDAGAGKSPAVRQSSISGWTK